MQTRLALAYGAVFVVVLSLLMLAVGQVVYRTSVSEAERHLQVAAILAANSLQDPLSGYAGEFEAARLPGGLDEPRPTEQRTQLRPPSPSTTQGMATGSALAGTLVARRLQEVAAGYGGAVGARVSLLDAQGNVAADSAYAFDQVPNQLGQPEVRAALAGAEERTRRVDPLSGQPALYAAAAVRQEGRIIGVVQMSRSEAAVTAQIRPLLLTLGLVGLAALAVASALGIGLGRQLVKPVRDLERASLAMAAGDLDQQVPVESADELGALATAFNGMAREVQRTLTQQRLFVASASHELRTPLTHIKLRSEALLGAAKRHPEVAERYIAEIDQEADRLGRLAGALLDLSRLDEGRGRPPGPELADIRPVLLDVAQMMALQAEQVGLALAADIPATLPPLLVRADDLEAILVNLLDNAVKYTPAPGRVALIVEVASGRCRIIVSDTGPGILPEDLPHIFERFYRADKARSRNVGASGQGSGAGLGLSIVQALVQQNDGQICVDSSPGQGTHFIVDFPLAPQT
jgi:signal transduction histidine kinase